MEVRVLLVPLSEGSHNWQCTGPENRQASACESSNLSPSLVIVRSSALRRKFVNRFQEAGLQASARRLDYEPGNRRRRLMAWQRRAKPPGEVLCRFDSCRLRLKNCECRIADFESDAVANSQFEIRSSRFGMYRRSPIRQRRWS